MNVTDHIKMVFFLVLDHSVHCVPSLEWEGPALNSL